MLGFLSFDTPMTYDLISVFAVRAVLLYYLLLTSWPDRWTGFGFL